MTHGKCTSANELAQAVAAAVETYDEVAGNPATALAAFGLGCCELIERCGLKLVAAAALLEAELQKRGTMPPSR